MEKLTSPEKTVYNLKNGSQIIPIPTNNTVRGKIRIFPLLENMCTCKTKIEFELDGGSLYYIKSLENSECPAYNECLGCTKIDENLDDGIYRANLICEINAINHFEGIEYDGENIVEDIEKIN